MTGWKLQGGPKSLFRIRPCFSKFITFLWNSPDDVPCDLVVRLCSCFYRVPCQVVEGADIPQHTNLLSKLIAPVYKYQTNIKESLQTGRIYIIDQPSCRKDSICHRNCSHSVAGNHLSTAWQPARIILFTKDRNAKWFNLKPATSSVILSDSASEALPTSWTISERSSSSCRISFTWAGESLMKHFAAKRNNLGVNYSHLLIQEQQYYKHQHTFVLNPTNSGKFFS